jgi:putative endonuclease
MEQYIVYIIYSSSLDKYYVGYTTDLPKRLIEHNSGISTYTARSTDWIVKYTQTYLDRESAMRREREIKNKKSRKYIEWLVSSPDSYRDG